MSKLVHILANGVALCGRQGVPSSWSAEEYWISAYDQSEWPTEDPPALVYCSACMRSYGQLIDRQHSIARQHGKRHPK